MAQVLGSLLPTWGSCMQLGSCVPAQVWLLWAFVGSEPHVTYLCISLCIVSTELIL